MSGLIEYVIDGIQHGYVFMVNVYQFVIETIQRYYYVNQLVTPTVIQPFIVFVTGCILIKFILRGGK